MQLEQQTSKNAVVIGLVAFPFLVLMFLAFLPMPSLLQWHQGDLWLYYDSSLQLMQGELPYRDFPLEYPPLALLPFVLPRLVTLGQSLSFTDYVRLFVLQNAVLSTLVALALVQVVLYWQRWRNSVPVLIVYALLVAISVPLLPWRYDLFPALLLNLRNLLVVVLILWLLVEYLPTSVRVAIAQYRRRTKPSSLNIPWFWIGMAGLSFLSVALRFWGLSRFNTLVFDEVYYAKYGNDYLNHIAFFDSHPPLGKYLIAIGIWIDTHNPFSHDSLKNALTGSLLSPFSYRWLNALIGSLIPLVTAGIAYQLSHRRSYAFIAGLFTAADGLLLVESRYALINIYLVIFGLLGQWFFLLALDNKPGRRGFWLALSGICFGASISVKWNGLGFLLGTYLIWICAWVIRWARSLRAAATDSSSTSLHNLARTRTPLQNLTQLNFLHLLFDFGAIPALVYCLAWIPHLQLNPTSGFWKLQQQILAYHQHVGSGPQEHPYCSSWYTWPWMIRPMGYFFATVRKTPQPVSSLGSPLSASAGEEIYYDVHGMGNPVLWWLSTAAIVLVLWILAQRIRAWATVPQTGANQRLALAQAGELWIALYLVLNWLANWLPWMKVTRCSFLYYYMSASVFAFLALAWIVERWLRSYQLWLRAVGVTIVFLILLALVFWLPIYLGLPLSPEEFQNRMWLRSWI